MGRYSASGGMEPGICTLTTPRIRATEFECIMDYGSLAFATEMSFMRPVEDLPPRPQSYV